MLIGPTGRWGHWFTNTRIDKMSAPHTRTEVGHTHAPLDDCGSHTRALRDDSRSLNHRQVLLSPCPRPEGIPAAASRGAPRRAGGPRCPTPPHTVSLLFSRLSSYPQGGRSCERALTPFLRSVQQGWGPSPRDSDPHGVLVHVTRLDTHLGEVVLVRGGMYLILGGLLLEERLVYVRNNYHRKEGDRSQTGKENIKEPKEPRNSGFEAV